MIKYNAIGLMSGTSLDGLDVAACEFFFEHGKWSFNILHCQTYPYSSEWTEKLAGLPYVDALTFSLINVEYGHLLGKLTDSFIKSTGFQPQFIASHGHTVFHQPGNRLTVQIGAGSAIAADTSIPVICDFRSVDLALGGQGAPLVPVGDRLLFSEYDACLNLGGFANVSLESDDKRVAFDICPANIVLNRLASMRGMHYDKNGDLARSGTVDTNLLEKLNNLAYYTLKYPKSLGREWLETNFLPLIINSNSVLEDMLRTICDHIAMQVNYSLGKNSSLTVMATGGGTHNLFLMERIKLCGNHQWVIPDQAWIDFKEALVFAFLGVLRWRQEINVFQSVTGSRTDHSGGAIYYPV